MKATNILSGCNALYRITISSVMNSPFHCNLVKSPEFRILTIASASSGQLSILGSKPLSATGPNKNASLVSHGLRATIHWAAAALKFASVGFFCKVLTFSNRTATSFSNPNKWEVPHRSHKYSQRRPMLHHYTYLSSE